MSVILTPELKSQVEKGISILKQGGVIAYPTDTVYGLGASMNISKAVGRIFNIKGRPTNMGLPLLLAEISQIKDISDEVPEIAWLLAHKFLPGALTLVLHKSDKVPYTVTGGEKTVAIRVPAHPIPVMLIEGTGSPVVGTSANLSGKPNALTADEVCTQIGDRIDYIIDGGKCPGGVESTIVDVTIDPPVVLREGAISIARLRKVTSNIAYSKGVQGCV